MKPRKRIRRASTKRAKELRQYAVRAKEWKEIHPFCRACHLIHLGPIRKTKDVHHSRGKIGRLLLMEQFWVPVCRTCHNWIDQNPNAARKLGLLCEKGLFNSVPALHAGTGSIMSF